MSKQKNILGTVFPILAAVFLFSLFMGWLYRNDNKYTHKGTQAISGMLILNQKTLEEEKIFYLTRGWQFYSGVLLSPDDFADGKTPDIYMQNITAGRQNNFDLSMPNVLTGGSASYRLIIALPKENQAYTLVLPEIYSAYRLYVNGTNLLSMGVPESKGFTEKIARRSVTFAASGQTEILLSVSNRSHFYDGMIYPLIFGMPEAVGQAENIRLLSRFFMLFFALLATGLSLYLIAAFHGRREAKMVLFFCVSLCVTLTFLYPVVFQFFQITPKLWYGIELFGIYGSYLFAVMLQNEISDAGPGQKKISALTLTAFTGISILYGLLPCYRVWQVQLYGALATLVKIFTVGYLLYSAVCTSIRNRPSSRFLMFCTTAFGISVLYDRLYPNWEPIWGGWPMEYGCMALALGLGMALWYDFSEGYRFKLTFTEERRRLTRQVAMQKAHYLELTDKIEDAIRIRHDERHHLTTLYGIFESGDYERLGEYLSNYVMTSMPKAHTVLCKNLVVDSMLRYYESLCRQGGIRFTSSVNLPLDIPVPDVELTILFGNLLENAYEAAGKKGEGGQSFISCQAMIRGDAFYLQIENSYVIPVRRRGERFLSAKHGGYGVGTQSARTVVENYGGNCVFEDKDGIFSVYVLFLLKNVLDSEQSGIRHIP